MSTHYGIIGCGMMGQEHLQNIKLLPDTKISAIYEPNEEMAQRAQSIAPEANICSTIDELLCQPEIDCLVIASPNFLHVEHLEKVAQSVSVPLLVEKPLFTSADDYEGIRAFQNSYKAPVWVAMEYRYMPPMQRFLTDMHGVVGDLKMLSITEHRFPFLEKVDNWNRLNEQTGGTFVEKCCHFFDLMRLIIGADPVKIMASAGQEVNHLDEIVNSQASDIWDCGYVIIDFANGVRSMLELSMFAEGSQYQEMIHGIGSNGKIEAKIPGPARLWSGPKNAQPVPLVVKSPRSICNPEFVECPVDSSLLQAGDHNGSTFYQHEKFLEVVRNNAKVEVTLEDGIWAVRMGQAAQLSAIEGRTVQI